MTGNSCGQLVRFAVHKNEIQGTTAGPVAKPKLFAPNKKNKLSTSRVVDQSADEIMAEGIEVVRKREGANTLYGWAKISRCAFKRFGLYVEDDVAPSTHSDVLGWPANEPQARKLLQQEIAKLVDCVVLLPEPIGVDC